MPILPRTWRTVADSLITCNINPQCNLAILIIKRPFRGRQFVANFAARWLANMRAWRHVCREHVAKVGIFLLSRLMTATDADRLNIVAITLSSQKSWQLICSRLIHVIAKSTRGRRYTSQKDLRSLYQLLHPLIRPCESSVPLILNLQTQYWVLTLQAKCWTAQIKGTRW